MEGFLSQFRLFASTGHDSAASWQLQVSHLSGPITQALSSLSSNTSGEMFTATYTGVLIENRLFHGLPRKLEPIPS
jgi:hypothetical protein